MIGNAQTMELDIPRKTKRRKKKLYEVFFTATDVPGAVTFTFKRKKRVKTVTVPIEDGIAEYRWKTPRKWPRGKTRVTATYVPSAGSPYTAAAVTDRVKVRGREPAPTQKHKEKWGSRRWAPLLFRSGPAIARCARGFSR